MKSKTVQDFENFIHAEHGKLIIYYFIMYAYESLKQLMHSNIETAFF